MFTTKVGPLERKEDAAYLRPETAQQMFTNFKLVMENARLKLPFGIAQIGRAFRNEISPRDFLFRSREFEQMEIEYFVHPGKMNECPFFDDVKGLKINLDGKEIKAGDLAKITSKWHAYWIALEYQWFLDLGIKKENLRLRQHKKDELAHYAAACFDIEYNFPFGWREIYGNADRTQYDLKQHASFSKTDLSYFDEESKERVVPYVAAEPSQGLDRAFLAFLFDAYEYDKARGNIVLHLHPLLAPVKVGVFPLVNKLERDAKKVFEELKNDFACSYDRSGSIGRRYARADEMGLPFCITIDFESLKDKAVTIRNRDDTKQIRVKISGLKEIIGRLLKGGIVFDKAGRSVK